MQRYEMLLPRQTPHLGCTRAHAWTQQQHQKGISHSLYGPPAGWLVQTGFPPSCMTNLSCICFTSSRTVLIRDLEVLPSLLLHREKGTNGTSSQTGVLQTAEITQKPRDYIRTRTILEKPPFLSPSVSIKGSSSPGLQHACSALSLLPAAARCSARSHQYHPRQLGYF